MKTETIIKRTKSRIIEKKNNIKRLAQEYVRTKSPGRERRIFSTMRSEKKEKKQLEQLLTKMENKKKTMPNMVWKKKKSFIDNILANFK